MRRYIECLLDRIIKIEHSSARLIASCCTGIFIACSPLLGVQTIAALGISWLLRLNGVVVFLVLFTINNPFTMVPLIVINYFIGYILFEYILHCPLTHMPVPFLGRLNTYLASCIDPLIAPLNFCIYYYIIGGFVCAGISVAITYLCLSTLFERIKK